MSFLRCTLLTVWTAILIFNADADNLSNDPTLIANPNALLKPQTRIAGTNLFLNTPYKMQDRTKPGCFATALLVETGKRTATIVCNEADQKLYNTPDASWIFERSDGSEDSIAEYNGKVIVKNLGTKLFMGLVLYKINLPPMWLILQTSSKEIKDPLGVMDILFNWNIRIDPNNKNNVQLERENLWLKQESTGNHRSKLDLALDTPADYPYLFDPDIELEAKMSNFEFTQPTDEQIGSHQSKKDLVDSFEIANNSPASLSRTITVSEKVTNEFSWGLSESCKIFSKITGSAGIPFITEGKVEAGLEVTVTGNQNWKTSNEKLFSFAYTVNVPANTTVKVSGWYDRIKDIEMPYTTRAEITGKSLRITVFDDVVKETTATGEMIRKQLEYAKFDGTVVEIKENSVITEIKGKMIASVGVRGVLALNGQSVFTQALPK